MPVMFRVVSVVLLCFAALFATMPTVQALSFWFAVYVGTISLFTTTTLNARLASLHSKAEAKRVYGIIAAGSQTGPALLVAHRAVSVFKAGQPRGDRVRLPLRGGRTAHHVPIRGGREAGSGERSLKVT